MMKIQEAKHENLSDWSIMRHRLWPESTVEVHRQGAEQSLGDKRLKSWIAFDWDRAIGFAEASVRPFANGCDSQPVVFLEGIWIDPDYREQGFGRSFIEAVESWARSQEIFEVGSDALIENELSHTTHEKWGFEATERVVYFRKKLT